MTNQKTVLIVWLVNQKEGKVNNLKIFLKGLGIFMGIIGLIAFGLAAAQLIGGGLGKAARASSESARNKLEQSIPAPTPSISERIQTARQQDEAALALSSITYLYDPRTNVCFAYLNIYDGYGASRSIAAVNCSTIPKNLLVTTEK